MNYLILRYGIQLLHDPTEKKIAISRFSDVLQENPDVTWGESVGNDFGLHLEPGKSGAFSIKGNERTFVCYEYLDGIAIHIEGSVQAIVECNRVANSIGCRLYFT